MTAATIQKLAWYKPRTSAGARLSQSLQAAIPAGRLREMEHYANCYRDLRFGWNFAHSMRRSNLPFPAFLQGKDSYLYRAYLFLAGCQDSTIEAAASITLNINSSTRRTIEALLVCDDIRTSQIASRLGIRTEVVDAYEVLFFNILDRKKDYEFVASVVYPEGRLVELYEDYTDYAGVADLLKRAGYNYGKEMVLYGSGIGRNPLTASSAAESASKFDGILMTTGVLAAQYGFAAQSKNAVSIANARMSMQAAKLGGVETSQNNMSASIGHAMSDILTKLAESSARETAQYIEMDVVKQSSQ